MCLIWIGTLFNVSSSTMVHFPMDHVRQLSSRVATFSNIIKTKCDFWLIQSPEIFQNVHSRNKLKTSIQIMKTISAALLVTWNKSFEVRIDNMQFSKDMNFIYAAHSYEYWKYFVYSLVKIHWCTFITVPDWNLS